MAKANFHPDREWSVNRHAFWQRAGPRRADFSSFFHPHLPHGRSNFSRFQRFFSLNANLPLAFGQQMLLFSRASFEKRPETACFRASTM
jgi:hypothetical protein